MGEKEGLTGRKTDWLTLRQTNRERETYRERNRGGGGGVDRQTDSLTLRQTNRERDTHRKKGRRRGWHARTHTCTHTCTHTHTYLSVVVSLLILLILQGPVFVFCEDQWLPELSGWLLAAELLQPLPAGALLLSASTSAALGLRSLSDSAHTDNQTLSTTLPLRS